MKNQDKSLVTDNWLEIKNLCDSFPFYVLLLDGNHHILLANKAVTQDLDVDPDKIIGEYCPKVIHGLNNPYPGCPLEEATKEGHAVKREFFDSDTKQWVVSSIYPTKLRSLDGGRIYIHFIQDITKRKRAEERVNASLREKVVLLQEIHHRVKNNLQIMISLLRLQSNYIKDKKVLQLLKESQDRVKSMALVHERLYQSKDLASIDCKEYIKDLVHGLFQSYKIDSGKIALRMDIKDVLLGIDRAIPCGLIINELVSNSLKHAFPQDREGRIRIALRSIDKNEIELKISDNGVGLAENVDFRKTKSLGLQLVTILVEDQLGGRIHLNRSKGTEFKITLKRGK